MFTGKNHYLILYRKHKIIQWRSHWSNKGCVSLSFKQVGDIFLPYLMINLLTIGFTKKRAEDFFQLLKKNQVKKLVDVRCHNNSQLAGFAKSENLGFFCKELLGISFEVVTDFAPSEELMKEWRARKITYDEYLSKYISELKAKDVLARYDAKQFDGACFLCSEASAEPCHRKILCEYLRDNTEESVVINHL